MPPCSLDSSAGLLARQFRGPARSTVPRACSLNGSAGWCQGLALPVRCQPARWRRA